MGFEAGVKVISPSEFALTCFIFSLVLMERCHAQVLTKGVPRACTAKACVSCGSGLDSTSRDRAPRGPVPPRSALNMYRGGAGLCGAVPLVCHH
ncbi:hypothetical protein N665_0015s0039 [Sinapis alba]|nr:hypothetical protein N665_0015s0039 [Sinapis alba]